MRNCPFAQKMLAVFLVVAMLLPLVPPVHADDEDIEQLAMEEDFAYADVTTIAKADGFDEETVQVPFTESAAAPKSKYITVDSNATGQTMLGLGGAMTESAAYNIAKLSPEKQAEIYEAYYGESGARYALTRSSIGSADFSTRSYSYDDSSKADPQLTKFSIEKDFDYIIPAIRMIQQYNPSVKFFAAPWAPPAWMKKSGKRQGGLATGGISLVNNAMDPKYYEAYANYLVKYCQEYAKAGIPVFSLSMQNEAQNNPQWECCTWTTSAVITFISNYLGPALEKNGINTKLVIWDWDKGNDTMHKDGFVKFNTTVLSNSVASKYIDGIAFHWYAGDLWHEIAGKPMWSEDFYSLDQVKAKFPNIHLYATEACQEKGSWFGSYEPAYRYIHDILNDFEHGTECFIDWNLVLDYNGGPTQGVENKCHAPIMLDQRNNICYQPSYYVMKMISRAVQPGTVHIKTDTDLSIDKTAVIDNEGYVSVLLGNTGDKAQSLTLVDGNYSLKLTLPANSLTTVRYLSDDLCDHDCDTYLDNQVDATCGEDGYTGDICCEYCGRVLTSGEVIPATGEHSWNEGEVTLAPTTTETGIMTYTCTVCAAEHTEEIPALPETDGEYIPLEEDLTNAEAAELLAQGEYFFYDSASDSYLPLSVTIEENSSESYLGEDGQIYDESQVSTTWTAKNGKTFTANSPYVTSSLKTYTRTHKTVLLSNRYWYVNDANSKDTTPAGSTAKAARNNFKNADEFRDDGSTGKSASKDDPYYVAAVYTAVKKQSTTTAQYLYTIQDITVASSSGDETACPVTIYAYVQEEPAVMMMALEEDEEPEEAPAETTDEEEAPVDEDEATTSEEESSNVEEAPVPLPQQLIPTSVQAGSFTLKTDYDEDVLKLDWQNAAVVSETWTPWNDTAEEDELGYTLYEIETGDILVDVYELTTPADDNQLEQLTDSIRDRENPAIVLVSASCGFTRDALKEDFIKVLNGNDFAVQDPWKDSEWDNSPWMNQSEEADRVFYVNYIDADVQLTINFYRIKEDTPALLEVRFGYQLIQEEYGEAEMEEAEEPEAEETEETEPAETEETQPEEIEPEELQESEDEEEYSEETAE